MLRSPGDIALTRAPRVTLYYRFGSAHYSQIHTGLARLHRIGAIELTQALWTAHPIARDMAPEISLMFADIDGAAVAYDVSDGGDIYRATLEYVSHYFKRGYDPRRVAQIDDATLRARVHPLGLNYEVYDDAVDPEALFRTVRSRGARGVLSAARSLLMSFSFAPRVATLEAPPMPSAPPRVLFLTRLWDQMGSTDDPRRAAINTMRIACVDALQSALGSAFVGGVEPTAFARRRCDRTLLAPHNITRKQAYLELMKATPICVSTAGLHESTGWKLAEYVACSRAIVSEPLTHRVPGDFAAGRNYLEFRDADGCVEAATRLLEEHALREQMMLNNHRYYHAFLKPEVLVLNTIATVLAGR